MKRSLFALAFCIIFCFAILAVTTSYYEESGVRDFESGAFDGVSIDDNGELYLAPEMRILLDKEDAFVWDLARAQNGDIWASTGVKGNIWRIPSGGEASLFANVGTAAAYSIALAPNGRVFAALSGPARILAIDANGRHTPLAQLENTYIWKLLYGSDGMLYAACGNPATLERIDPANGRVERLFTAGNDSHILAMAEDRAGNIYFGTEGRGTLYKRTRDGRVRALYTCHEDQISCITIDPRGRVYFGTASQRRHIPDFNFDYSNDSFTMREREQRLQEAQEREEEEYGAGRRKQRPHRNSIYRLNLDDSVEKIFTMSDISFYSLAIDNAEALYAGSGDFGVIYRIDASGRTSRVLRIEDSQILCLLTDGVNLFAGTGNDGRVYAISRAHPLSGTYTSRVLDCRANVTFGSLSWNALVPRGANLVFSTRSGNTNPVDETWSDWSAPYTQAAGSKIMSPRARFLQYRFTMTSPSLDTSPRLYSLRIPFLHDNRAPRIRGVTLTTYAESRRSRNIKLNPGQALLTWQSEDDDNDLLEHTIYFRMNDDPTWRILRINPQENQALLNAEILPDGWYQFRVVASDRPSNPDNLAKRAFADSRRVLIDNTPPVIRDLAARVAGDLLIITGVVEDALSPIGMIRYSLNAEDWVYTPPADGIFDSLSEDIRIVLSLRNNDNLIDGSNIIFIRACDQHENWTTAQLIFRVQLPDDAFGKRNSRRFHFLD
jgi:sugar lactone lactonase YvrE